MGKRSFTNPLLCVIVVLMGMYSQGISACPPIQQDGNQDIKRLAGQSQSIAQVLDPGIQVKLTGETDGLVSVNLRAHYENGKFVEFIVNEKFSDGRPDDSKQISLADLLASKQPLYKRKTIPKLPVMSASADQGFTADGGGSITIEFLKEGGLSGTKYGDFALNLSKSSQGRWKFCIPAANKSCSEVTALEITGFKTTLHGGIKQITASGPEGDLPQVF